MNRNTNPTPPKKPSWWSPKSGLLLAAGFGIAAAWPFISSATKLAAAGEEVSMDKVMKDAKEEEEKREKMEPEKYREVKAYAVLPDGTGVLGTKGGLFLGKNGGWKYDGDFPGGDVKNLTLAADGTLWAATKKGVYQRPAADGKWQQAYDKEVHSITVSSTGEVFATGKAGVVKRGADGTWQSVVAELPANAVPVELTKKAEEEKMKEKAREKDKEKEHDHGKSEEKGGHTDG